LNFPYRKFFALDLAVGASDPTRFGFDTLDNAATLSMSHGSTVLLAAVD
jgi:hypothetical protein